MVKARIAVNKKVLMVFDTLQHKMWELEERVSQKGIEVLLKRFIEAGVSFDDVSAVALTDVYDKPKASDYKYKAPYIEELIETHNYNVIIPIGAGAFEKMTGIKGAAKYAGKTLISEKFPGQKVLACPSPAQAKYDPGVHQIIAQVVRKAAIEKEYPEIREGDKLPTHYSILDTMPKVEAFFQHFLSEEVPYFAYDLETTGLYFNIDEITTIQFSHKPGYSYLIPALTKGDYPAAPNIWSPAEWEHIISLLWKLFADPGKVIIGHNKKFDDKFIYHHWGIPLQKGRSWDTMIASFLCDENTPNGLKELTCQLTDMGDYELPLEKFKDAYCKEHKLKKKEFSYALVPFEILSQYALCDTDATIRLYLHYLEELKKEEQEHTFGLLMRITWLLTRFELNGWPVNVPYGMELKKKMTLEIAELQEELMKSKFVHQATRILGSAKLDKLNSKRKSRLKELKEPFEFNLGSTAQKRVLFFDVMKLPVVKRTKKGKGDPATDKESVSIWMRTQPQHREFLQQLQHYSEMCKFLSTYVMGILNKTVNGRVHGVYNACGAKTGRTSSRDPNLQNLPARGDERKMKLVKAIKKMFEAPEGYLMLGADLSAIEMVWAAIVSGDEKLIEIFRQGIDIHGAIAIELFDYIKCHPNEVKKLYEFERNSVSKTVQFLSIYGGGADALARKVNDSIAERQEMAKAKGEVLELQEYTKDMAQEILDNYFHKYQGVDRYIKDTTLQALQQGYVTSFFGYRRRIPAVNSTDEGVKAQAVRQATNATIQNPASVGLLLSLCNLQEEIDAKVEAGEWAADDYLLTGPIHDAAYQQVRSGLIIEARDLLLSHMTTPPMENCPVPIRAEAEWGKTWADFTTDFGSALVDAEEEDDEEDDIEEAA